MEDRTEKVRAAVAQKESARHDVDNADNTSIWKKQLMRRKKATAYQRPVSTTGRFPVNIEIDEELFAEGLSDSEVPAEHDVDNINDEVDEVDDEVDDKPQDQ